MLQKLLRLTGLDSDIQKFTASAEARAFAALDHARAVAVRSAIVVAIVCFALTMLMIAIAVGLVALYFYLAGLYGAPTALAIVAGALLVIVVILGLVAMSIAKGQAAAMTPLAHSGAPVEAKLDAVANAAAGVVNAPTTADTAVHPALDAGKSRLDGAEVRQNVQEAADEANRRAQAAARAAAAPQPSLSKAADAIFSSFGSQVNNEKEFMSSAMSVLGHFVRTPKTGVGPIDDMINNVAPRFQAVGEEAANQAADFVRTSDRKTFWAILGTAAAIGFVVARNNKLPPDSV